ncbi:MAG: hypothetical protein ACYCZY_07590 [Lacisediminihabitans sp.]
MGRPVDRGHLIPFTAGGLYGPNLFRQDRALNGWWSVEGRGYRRIEDSPVASEAFFFRMLVYADDSDFPALIELGVVLKEQLEVRTLSATG